MINPYSIYKRPSDDILEGTVVWHLITDKGNEYWGDNRFFAINSWEKEHEYLLGSWRLDSILSARNEFPVHMDIRFRTHIISLPPNKDGYYFARGVLGNPSQGTKDMYTVGYLEDDQVFCQKLIIPELYPWSEEVRSIEKCHNGLIRRINPSSEHPNQLQPQHT